VAKKFGKKGQGEIATGVLPERPPARLHYVVGRDGDEGLEVLRVPLAGMEGEGEVLPVFSAGWAARGYLFAEAPGGGWYVRACTPDELASLLVWHCASVEWVALDPRPWPRIGGEAATVMPRESFVDYLLAFSGDAFPYARPVVASREETSATNTTSAMEHDERDGRPVSRHDGVNGNAREEVTTMWSKLFGGGDRLPREKVDAVVRVIDRYLAEEAGLRGFHTEKQTIHPRDLPPDKRRTLIEEVFAILGDARKN
jgi:hypothetical protein